MALADGIADKDSLSRNPDFGNALVETLIDPMKRSFSGHDSLSRGNHCGILGS